MTGLVEDVRTALDRLAAAAPEAPAVSCSGATVDRRTLAGRANGLAAALVGSGPVVGILLPRSVDLVVAQLACWAAGAAFCVLDPALPDARLADMVAVVGLDLVVTDTAGRRRLPAGLAAVAPGAPPEAAGSRSPRRAPTDLAYVIFTSGSTGRPKAVAVAHDSLAAVTAAWQARYQLIEHGDRVAQLAGLGFDVAVADLVRGLVLGGGLVLPDAEEQADPYRLLELLRRERVSWVELTPSRLAAISAGVDQLPVLPELRCLLLGGERMDPEHVRMGRRLLGPDGRLFNTYGITETTIDSTSVELSRTGPVPDPVPLGTVLDGHTISVRDAELRCVAEGQAYLGGSFVARGYLGDPAATAERFVPDPDGAPGSRMFRSGDRVRREPDHGLHHLGRDDRQVKVAGVRVDLEEVERVLSAVPAVVAGAVVLADDGLQAHVVLRPGVDPAGVDVPAVLATRLPAAMVPRTVRVHPTLPVTPAGKLDRAALVRDAETGRRSAPPPVPGSRPGPSLVDQIAVVMAEVLQGAPIPTGDFFARGGTSLSVTVLLGRLRTRLGVAPPSVADVWRYPTPVGLAAVCRPVAAEAPTAVGPARRTPLSPGQHGLWLAARLRPGDPANTVRVRVALDGEVYIAALHRAVATLADRHPALRTVVEVTADGIPYAVVRDHLPEPLLLRKDDDAPDPWATPWDLATGPLFRVVLTRRPGGGWLDVGGSHLVLDGESVRILLADLTAALQQRELPPPVHAPSTPEPVRQESLSYWSTRLAGTDTPLPAPRTTPSPTPPTRRDLSPETLAGVRRLAAEACTSPFVVLLAAWFAVQRRWSGRDEVVVGVPFGDRTPQTVGAVGFFVDTVPIRIDLPEEEGADAAVARVHAAVLEARTHRGVPYHAIAAATGRSGQEAPLFGSWFNYLGPIEAPPTIPGLVTAMVDPPGLGGPFASNLYLTEVAEGLRLDLLVGPTGPDGAHATALLDRYVTVVESWAGRRAVPRATGTDHHHAPRPEHRSDLGRRLAAALPAARGVRADRVAERVEQFRRAGLGPGDLVAVVAPRGVDLVEALLGLVIADLGFCLVDADLPAPWREEQLRLARPRAVLTLRSSADRLEVLHQGRRDADYVQFTSGTSTGVPRPVRSGYAELLVALEAYLRVVALGPADRVGLLAGLGHDPGLREVFGTVLAGAELLVPPAVLRSAPRELLDWLIAEQVTVVHLTPGLLRALAAVGAVAPDLRLLVCGGDLLLAADTAGAARLAPNAELVNAYGATETPQVAAYGIADPAGVGPVPVREIGEPHRLLVLDRQGEATAVGEVGQVVVESTALAFGYDEDDPAFGAGGCPRCRRYATGDRGRRLADGAVELLGRDGDEISVGAERVHLAAVAALVRRELPVRDVAAVGLPGPAGEGRLAVALVPAEAGLDPVTVRRRLRRVAPAPYVPAVVLVVDQIPRDARGKPDRGRLVAQATRAVPAAAPRAADEPPSAAPLAAVVAGIYGQVLGVPDPPHDVNFFELGGTSLAMARVVHLLETRLERRLPALLLFEHPSIAGLSAALAPAAEGASARSVGPVRRPGHDPSTSQDAHRRAALRRAIRQGDLR